MKKFSIELTTSGSAGSATAEGVIQLHDVWKVYAITIDFTEEPGTTDVTITDGEDPVTSNVLVQANGNTDKVYYPRTPAAKTADGSASTLTEVCPVAEALKVSVAQGDPGKKVRVIAVVER